MNNRSTNPMDRPVAINLKQTRRCADGRRDESICVNAALRSEDAFGDALSEDRIQEKRSMPVARRPRRRTARGEERSVASRRPIE